MISAIIDAPWIQDADGWRPDYDGGYTDVTGEDWYEWNGEQVKGGNYPPGAGLPSRYLQYDWVMLKITVEDDAALAALDAQDKHQVYWSQEIVDA